MIRKADPAARRQALFLIATGVLIGAALLMGFERYSARSRQWLSSEPKELAYRVKVVCAVAALLTSVPVLAVAAYVWRFSAAVISAQECPPPGRRVIRDTPVVVGPAAVFRGRGFQVLAACLAVAAAIVSVMLWRLARALTASMA
jgi:hypothetical protein